MAHREASSAAGEETGHSCFTGAAYEGDMAVVLALVEAGADVEKRGEGGVPVVGAVKGGQLAILVYLVEECGASLRHVDNYIGTILHQAAHFGHLDIVRYVWPRGRPS